jgi:hypothetical protein
MFRPLSTSRRLRDHLRSSVSLRQSVTYAILGDGLPLRHAYDRTCDAPWLVCTHIGIGVVVSAYANMDCGPECDCMFIAMLRRASVFHHWPLITEPMPTVRAILYSEYWIAIRVTSIRIVRVEFGSEHRGFWFERRSPQIGLGSCGGSRSISKMSLLFGFRRLP